MTHRSPSPTRSTVPPEPALRCMLSVSPSFFPKCAPLTIGIRRYWNLHSTSGIPRSCHIRSHLVRNFLFAKEVSDIFLLKCCKPQRRWERAWNSCRRNRCFQSIVRCLCSGLVFYLLLICALVPIMISGVAKGANVVAVKVLDDDGTGQNSDM